MLRVKGAIFDALFNRALPRSPEVDRAFREIGVDLDQLENDYPLDRWVMTIEFARRHFHPELSPADADMELGRRFVHGYQATLIGSIIMAAVRHMDPGSLIDRFPRFASSGRDEVSAEVERLESGRRVHYHAVNGLPHFVAGCLLECLESCGTKAKVEIGAESKDTYAFTIRW